MKQKILIAILLLCTGVAGYTFSTVWRVQQAPQLPLQSLSGAGRMLEVADETRAQIDLDAYMRSRPRKEGTREIGPLKPVVFEAVIEQAPVAISTSYLQEAFGVLGLVPLPPVSHRMFVETAQGLVIPVYVWDEVAASFTADPAPVRMLGFHIYTYSKGPAIVVDGAI